MQSSDVEQEAQLDNINELQTRKDIRMIPDSFTSSDTEEDILLKDQLTLSATPPAEDDVKPSSETLRAWFQRIAQMQNDIQRKLMQSEPTPPPPAAIIAPTPAPPPPTATRVVKYQDLPYMGEMTLDNSKPRRGRKPKKADICHLIYKNYGTIFPGTPNPKSLIERTAGPTSTHLAEKRTETASNHVSHNHRMEHVERRSDVQNRIISSLLERRLTQESKRHHHHQQQQHHGERKSTKVSAAAASSLASDGVAPEPLNLCVRDSNVQTIDSLIEKIEVKVEHSDEDADDDVEFVHETPSPATSAASNGEFKFPPDFATPLNPQDIIKLPENGVPPGGYVYWPHAGVFIHPMALQQQLLYYQKMTGVNPNDGVIPQPVAAIAGRSKSKASSTKSETTNSDGEEELDSKSTKRSSSGTAADKLATKRKRSAIFIPPIPPENQNNPATEVSICKFKFTGGAKPSLQEKKMLSVDSGGNFRYYSGTGDKSMRGYEFFPRETLQQQVHNTHGGSSTGAFLQASGERIYPSSPVDFTHKVNEFMLTPELKQPPGNRTHETVAAAIAPPADAMRTKKRKSRKSLQREKLEQTFKEKGFLIQTQQLESAEGATYCKFRQLRKFTRYLFRSWKDYLPGNVGENPEGASGMMPHAVEMTAEEADTMDTDTVSNMSSSRMSTSPAPVL